VGQPRWFAWAPPVRCNGHPSRRSGSGDRGHPGRGDDPALHARRVPRRGRSGRDQRSRQGGEVGRGHRACRHLPLKDSFYGELEPDRMPVAERLHARWKAWVAGGAICSEMEAAGIFIVSRVLRVRAGGIMLIAGNDEGWLKARRGRRRPTTSSCSSTRPSPGSGSSSPLTCTQRSRTWRDRAFPCGRVLMAPCARVLTRRRGPCQAAVGRRRFGRRVTPEPGMSTREGSPCLQIC